MKLLVLFIVVLMGIYVYLIYEAFIQLQINHEFEIAGVEQAV